jgi:hypothetical protein
MQVTTHFWFVVWRWSSDMTLDSYAAGGIMIVASALVAVLGLVLVRKTYNVRTLVAAHEISGQYLSIVGTMYAVLLGLIVVDAMSRFQQAVTTVEEEANALSELIFLSGRMPTTVRTQVHERAINYAQLVIDEEWPLMSQGESLPAARTSAIDLMRTVRDWEPVTESEKTAYASALPAAAKLWNERRERILRCQRGVPALEWGIVILGGFVTVTLTYVFVFDDLKIQIGLTAMVALLISLNIFLILMFGYPFSGDLSVSPESFKAALAATALGTPINGSR